MFLLLDTLVLLLGFTFDITVLLGFTVLLLVMTLLLATILLLAIAFCCNLELLLFGKRPGLVCSGFLENKLLIPLVIPSNNPPPIFLLFVDFLLFLLPPVAHFIVCLGLNLQ